MASLQFVIDTICSRLTVATMYGIVRERLGQGAFDPSEIVPVVRGEDRSLDSDSARQLVDAAVADLAARGELRIERDRVRPV